MRAAARSAHRTRACGVGGMQKDLDLNEGELRGLLNDAGWQLFASRFRDEFGGDLWRDDEHLLRSMFRRLLMTHSFGECVSMPHKQPHSNPYNTNHNN